MNIQYLTPWNIGGAVTGLVLSVAIVIGLLRSYRQLGVILKSVSGHLFSQIGFFSLVIVVFLIISVLESGDFFNSNITHQAIFGLLGYALALGFDLVSIVCMLARLNAERMKDSRGSRLNLMGVIVCALVSAFANASSSLQGYNPALLNHTPGWMQAIAPWLGLIFPTMIVILSMTTDHILDHAPTRGIDVATFREREQKRVALLQVRLETEKAMLALETELASLRQEREQSSGKVAREWIFWTWLRPPVPAPKQASAMLEQINQGIEQAVQVARTALEEQLAQLHMRLDETIPLAAVEIVRLSDLQTQMDTWTRNMTATLSGFQASLDQMCQQVSHLEFRNKKHNRATPQEEKQEQGPAERRDHGNLQTTEQSATAQRILAALKDAPDSSDRQVARDIGCSRPTVARWRRRFQAQGLLGGEKSDSEPPHPLVETTA
jgi:hypothetical protein